jgi:hypothetical protein
MVVQLNEALACPGPTCAVQGQYFNGFGSPAVQLTGSVNVTTGAVALTMPGSMPGAPAQTFNGVIDANSRTMAGQLSGAGAVTFTKQ